MKLNRTYVFIMAILFFWLLDLASKIGYNGLVYGLDYGLFHPDGKLYTFRTLTLIGHSQIESGNLVSSWYLDHAYKLNKFEPESLFYDLNPLWDLYKPRILYPLLSTPFVALLGIYGMLVIPALSMLTVMLAVYLIGRHLNNPILGLVIAIFISFSDTINRWMFANTTDSLLTGLTAIFVLILLKLQQSRFFLFHAILLIALTSLTRVAVLQWVGISVVLFFTGHKKYAISLLTTAVAFFIPTLYRNASTAILPNEPDSNIFMQFLQLLTSLVKVAFYEIAQLAVLDRLLLSLLLLATLVSLANMERLSSKYFIAILISLWITGAINGTVGVNFRYQLPIITFMAWSLIDNFSTLSRVCALINKKIIGTNS